MCNLFSDNFKACYYFMQCMNSFFICSFALLKIICYENDQKTFSHSLSKAKLLMGFFLQLLLQDYNHFNYYYTRFIEILGKVVIFSLRFIFLFYVSFLIRPQLNVYEHNYDILYKILSFSVLHLYIARFFSNFMKYLLFVYTLFTFSLFLKCILKSLFFHSFYIVWLIPQSL